MRSVREDFHNPDRNERESHTRNERVMQHACIGKADVADAVQLDNQNQLQRIASITAKLSERDRFDDPIGGVVVEIPSSPCEHCESLLHFGEPDAPEKGYVSIPSPISPIDALLLRNHTVWTAEFSDMMVQAAKAYQDRAMFLLEGESSLGKTFAIGRFVEFLYGCGATPEDFYCHAQNEASEFLGRWVPVVENPAEREKLRALLSDPRFTAQWQAVNSLETPTAELEGRLTELALELGIAASTRWKYEYGALPRAMILQRGPQGERIVDPHAPGEGCILHLEEIRNAGSGVINLLLALGGEHGAISPSIQLYSDSGREIPTGSKFWLAMSANPPDGVGYLERRMIDPALENRCVVWRQADAMSLASHQHYSRKFFLYAVGNAPEARPENCKVDLSQHEQLAVEIAEVAGMLHHELGQLFKNGERGGRRQGIAVNLRDLARLATYVLHFQAVAEDGSSIDAAATLAQAVDDIYLARLAAPELKADAHALVYEVLHGPTGMKEWKGEVKTRNDIFRTLSAEVANAEEGLREHIEREEAINAALRERGTDNSPLRGLIAEERVDSATGMTSVVAHIGNPYSHHSQIVTLPSRLTKKDLETLNSQIVWTPEFSEIFLAAAKARQTDSFIIFEGETSLGKTFAIDRLSAILFGKDADGNYIKPENMYCNAQTEASEFTGKMVPSLVDRREAVRVVLESDWGQKQIGKLREETQQMDSLSDEEKSRVLEMRIREVAKGLGGENSHEWRFQPGALQTSMTMRFNQQGKKDLRSQGEPRGCILHIQEIGLIRPGVAHTLFPMGGEHGRIARRIQNHVHGSSTVKAGSDFWLCGSTNPPEGGYLARNELDQALVARSVLYRYSKPIRPSSIRMVSRRIFSFSVGNDPGEKPPNCLVPFHQDRELAEAIGDLVGRFHVRAVIEAKRAAGSRKNTIPLPTLRTLGLTANRALSFQIVHPESGEIDMIATLRSAIEDTYSKALGANHQLRDVFRDLFSHELQRTVRSAFGTEHVGDNITRLAREFDIRDAAGILGAEEQEVSEAIRHEAAEAELEAARNALEEALADPALADLLKLDEDENNQEIRDTF